MTKDYKFLPFGLNEDVLFKRLYKIDRLYGYQTSRLQEREKDRNKQKTEIKWSKLG